MIELRTNRLLLRMYRESDFEAYAEMSADPEVMKYIGDGKPLDRPMAWRNMATMIGHWHLRGYGLWAVEELATGEFIGRIGCWNPEGWLGFEIGWMLRRGFWGRGFATEAAEAALRFAFEDLRIPRIISQIHPMNNDSIRVAKRLGEQRIDSSEVFGHPVDVYSLSQEEWRSR